MKIIKLLLAICVASVVAPLYPLDAAQPGEKLWEFQTGGGVYSSPAIAADGTVYVGSLDDKVYALNGTTGQKFWEFQTGERVWSSPAIGADGTVYVGSGDDNVYALNGTTGQKLWEFQTGGSVHSSPAIGADGAVYVASSDGDVYALNGATGQKLWDFQTDGRGPSPAIGADGTVYVESIDGKVYALNGATGQKQWEFQTGGLVYSSPAIGADGTLYVGSDDRKVYALCSSSVGGLAQSPWPKFGGDAQNSHRVNSPPSIRWPSLTVLKEGSQGLIAARVSGKPTPQVQWYFNGAAVSGGTHATLILLPVTRAMEGTYSLVASNVLGQATSASIAAVVSNVDLERFVGLQWSGHPESGLSIESTDRLGPEAIWQTRTNYPPASTEQRFVELAPAAATGFYRLSGSGSSPAITQVGFVNGWRYVAPAGTQHRIEYTASATGWTNWQLLNNLVLPASPYLFLDDASLGAPSRVYRTTPVP